MRRHRAWAAWIRRCSPASLALFGGLVMTGPAACQARPATPVGSVQTVDTTGLRARLVQLMTAAADVGFSGSIAVAVGGEVLLRAAVGNADESRGIPITPGTLFDIGSITKPFTAAAILKLEELGRLRVTDRLGQFFPGAPADKRDVTLHQLLTHTAGFGEQVAGDYEPVEREEFVQRAFAAPLEFQPGSRYQYSNVGYSLLAAVIEVVSGEGYEAFLQANLLRPAGLTRTGYQQVAVAADSVAIGYRDGRPLGRPNALRWAADGPYWGLRGNGGLLSTPSELLAWDRALREGRVLSAATLARAYTRHVEEGAGAGTWYGYGWALVPTPRQTTLVTHNGGNGYFFADLLRYVEEGVTIALAVNRPNPQARQLGREVARMVFDPGYTPVLAAPAAPVESTTVPGGARGDLVQAIVAALQDGSESRLRRLIADHFESRFAAMVPLEQHLTVLGRMSLEVRGRTIERIREAPEGVDVVLVAPGRAPMTLNVMLSGGPVPKVAGMGLDG